MLARVSRPLACVSWLLTCVSWLLTCVSWLLAGISISIRLGIGRGVPAAGFSRIAMESSQLIGVCPAGRNELIF